MRPRKRRPSPVFTVEGEIQDMASTAMEMMDSMGFGVSQARSVFRRIADCDEFWEKAAEACGAEEKQDSIYEACQKAKDQAYAALKRKTK